MMMNKNRRIGTQPEQPDGQEPADTPDGSSGELESAPGSASAEAASPVEVTSPAEGAAPHAEVLSVNGAIGTGLEEPDLQAEAPDALAGAAAIPDQQAQADQVEAVADLEVEGETGVEEMEEAGAERLAQTAPLPKSAEAEELTPLPVNAVVNGRYVVQAQLYRSAERNLYRVTARRQQRCANCGRLSSLDEELCRQCGSQLEGHSPVEFYLMAESFRAEALMSDPDLMRLQLYHPNIVPVVDFFTYKPFGHERHYAVAEPRQGARLSQLSMPRPRAQVLAWAVQLADALAYLHEQGVVGAGAEADDILVQGDTAALASLQNARAAPEDGAERSQQQSMDLARLAATIYEAYTGQPASMAPDGALAVPSEMPERLVSALRAAIEPVQGVAPAIPASQWRDQLANAAEAVAELEKPARPVAFVAAGLTDVGQLREQNQDSFGMAEYVQASEERPQRMGLYVVADGLGGHKGGEIASAIAVQAFCGEVLGRIMAPLAVSAGGPSVPTSEAILQGMSRALQSANDRIYKARDNRQNDMGTTLVAALIAGGKAYIVNVGDSRLYLHSVTGSAQDPEPFDSTAPLKPTGELRRGAGEDQSAEAQVAGPGDEGHAGDGTASGPEPSALAGEGAPEHESGGALEGAAGEPDSAPARVLTQVSVDHSLVHRLVELGQLDPEEAKVHPHRNFIYRSLGGPPPIEVDTFVRTLRPGQRLLLCSDGLNSMVEDDDIEAVLDSEPDPQLACQRLIDLANEAGGHDNITVIIVDVIEYL